jgi:hypothetical protein
VRSYPRNSPEAAARIVALVLIADGHVCRSEFDVLNHLDGPRRLGLESDGLPRIVQTLCEDLLMGDHGSGSMLGGVDDSALAALMAEVDEPAPQRKVLPLASLPPALIDTLPTGKPRSWRLLAAIGASAEKQGQATSSLPTRRPRERKRSGARRGDDLQHKRVLLPAA